MSISKEFKQAVESGEIMRVRIMMKNDLLVDKTFDLFDEMAQYAESVLGGKLYDEHDGDELKFDASAWDKDYLNLHMVKVVNNFSRERIDLLKKMIAFIYKDEVKKATAERARQNARQNVTVQRRQIDATKIITVKTMLFVIGAVIVVGGVAIILSDILSDK